MVKAEKGVQIVVWQYELMRKINSWSKWVLNLAENDIEIEKKYLYLSAFEFFRWYQEYLLDYDHKKEEIEKLRKS